MYDLFFLRNGKDKREVRLTPMLVSIQKQFWKVSQIYDIKISENQSLFNSFYSIVKLITWNNMHKSQTSVCIRNFSI
jgi:hypothetical protein